MGMADHSDQQLSAREMVRAHTYPLLAAISTISLLTITVLSVSYTHLTLPTKRIV